MTIEVNSLTSSTRRIPVQVGPANEIAVPVRKLTVEELEERIALAAHRNSSTLNAA